MAAGLASAEDIDTAIKSGLGYKMGPCTLIDLIGLDTQILLGEAFYPITLDRRASVPPLLRRMVAAGKLGNKSGQGLLAGLAVEPAQTGPEFQIHQTAAKAGRSPPAIASFQARQKRALCAFIWAGALSPTRPKPLFSWNSIPNASGFTPVRIWAGKARM